MKAFTTTMMLTIAFRLLLLFTILTESCKKVSVSGNQAMPEAFTIKNASEAMALPHTKQFDSKVATGWFRLLSQISRTNPLVPAPSARIFAYSGLAFYESVVPGMPSYQSMYQYFTGNSIEVDKKKDYFWPACANAAIARIASRLMGNYSATPNLGSIQQLEASFNSGFQTLITADQLQLSNDFGKQVADVIYEWSKTDGTLRTNGTLAVCPPYVPLGGPGNWVPTPPQFFPATGACQGSLRTFIPGIVNSTLPAPPPAYSTDPGSVFYQAANEVYQNSLIRTQDDIKVINNWRDIVGTNYNGPAHALKILVEIVVKEQLNLEDAAVLFAKHTIAFSDAIGAAFEGKFHYSVLRPVTFIRGVMGYNTWNTSYNSTQQHPSYPAVASSTYAAAAEIWENVFGKNYAFVDSTHNWLYGSFSFSSFDDMLLDIERSRTYSGANFKFATDAGVIQGRIIGHMVNQLPFKKE